MTNQVTSVVSSITALREKLDTTEQELATVRERIGLLYLSLEETREQLERAERREAALREALADVLTHFATSEVLDAVDDDLGSGIRPCPPDSKMRIRDVRRWRAALASPAPQEPESMVKAALRASGLEPERLYELVREVSNEAQS